MNRLQKTYAGLCIAVLASVTPAWSAAFSRQLFAGLKQAASKAQQYRSMGQGFLQRTKSTREARAKKLLLGSGVLMTAGGIVATDMPYNSERAIAVGDIGVIGIGAGVAGIVGSWALFFPQSTAAITGGLITRHYYKQWQAARLKRQVTLPAISDSAASSKQKAQINGDKSTTQSNHPCNACRLLSEGVHQMNVERFVPHTCQSSRNNDCN